MPAPVEGDGWPVYQETLTWTNNHGGHANEQYCWYEIYGYNRVSAAWELVAEASTWDGSSTNATETVNVANPSDENNNTKYSKWKVRINDKRQSCDDTYKYSSYTSDVDTSITSNPCDT
jgi:hypothetical protein